MRKKHSEVDESEKRQRHIQEMEEKLKQLAGGETQFGFSASCSDELHAPSLRTPAFGQSLPYSIRNAFMGEMEAARSAGIIAAKKEQVASAMAATVSASGSQVKTP